MKNLDKAILDTYRQLYANATPPADFDKLLDEAPLNEHGQKVIDFMAYEIEQETHDRIMQDAMKRYKIKHKILKNAFKFTIDLGCSPRIKTKEL
jgi:heme oxygenase